MVDTGYDEVDGVEDTHRRKSWTLERVSFAYPQRAGTVLAQIRCNDTVRANIYLDTEEEFEWLKERLTGVQPSKPPSIE
jgi:hypothetical protein